MMGLLIWLLISAAHAACPEPDCLDLCGCFSGKSAQWLCDPVVQYVVPGWSGNDLYGGAG